MSLHRFTYCILLLTLIELKFSVAVSEEVEYDESNGKCEKLLMKYANSSADFTQCFIEHARPITVCQNCVLKYFEVLTSYEEISKTNDTGKYCELILLNVDRLQVLRRNYEYVTKQWEQASCTKCFKQKTMKLNDNTEEILLYHNLTKTCIETASNDTKCTSCESQYTQLNDFYDSHNSFNGFCMDIVDLMNSTRYYWSVTLGCCTNRREYKAPFFVVVSCTCALPVIFYFLIWLCATDSFQEISYQRRWTQKFQRLPSSSSS